MPGPIVHIKFANCAYSQKENAKLSAIDYFEEQQERNRDDKSEEEERDGE